MLSPYIECCTSAVLLIFSAAIYFARPLAQSHESILVKCYLQGHNDPSKSKVKFFKLLLDKYVYSESLGTFVPMPSMPAQLPMQLCSAARALQAIDQGKSQL